MGFSPKIDIVCFENIGRFRARLARFDADVKSPPKKWWK